MLTTIIDVLRMVTADEGGNAMCIYIEMKDLVANAFIDLLEKEKRREIRFSELDAYGARVIEVLNEEEETRAVLVVSRESQQAVVEDYSDLFEPATIDGSKGIRLKEGVGTMQLWERFCVSMSVRVIMAFKKIHMDEVIQLNESRSYGSENF